MRLTAILTLAALAAPAAAQVHFTAQIEKASLPSICQEETHVIPATGTLLRSTLLDLDKYVGKPFEFTATLAGVTCPVWYVTDAQLASSTLVWCGNPVPGCPVRLRVGPTGVLGQWFLWASGGPAFLPLDAWTGTVQLAPPWSLLGSGPTYGTTGTSFDASLPSDPTLVGLDLHAQGARMDIGPVTPLKLTNSVRITIWPLSPPCQLPGC